MKGIIQNNANDCGMACLATICQYHGYNKSLTFFKNIINYGIEGASIYDICQAAQIVKLKTTVYYGTINEIIDEENNKKFFPCIVHTKTNDGYYHYIVIKKIKRKKIYAFDPAFGNCKYKDDEFEKIWTGYMITFEKALDFKCCKEKKYERYYKLMLEEKYKFGEIILLSSITVAVEMCSIVLYQKVIDNYTLSFYEGSLENKILWIMKNLETSVGVLLLVYFLGTIISVIRGKIFAKLTVSIHKKMLFEFVNKSMNLTMNYFANNKTGETISRIGSIELIKNSLCSSSVLVVMNICILIVTSCYLLYLRTELFVVVLSAVVLYSCIIIAYKKPIKYNMRNKFQKEAEIIAVLSEVLERIETIKTGCGEETKIKDIEEKINHYLKYEFKNETIQITKSELEQFIAKVINVIVFGLGCFLIVIGEMTFGEWFAFQLLLSFFWDSMKNLAEQQEEIQNIIVNIGRLDDVYEAICERENNEEFERIDVIKFENVGLSYAEGKEKLHRINIEFVRGEKIGIVGKNGSGKTTMMKLLLRLYEVSKGDIKINDKNINRYSKKCLRKNIVYISQTTDLFSDTIQKNLILNDEKIDKDKIDEAMEICELKPILENKGMTLESLITEGKNFSLGEKQRIIIARGILQEPEVLILDEAINNIDDESGKRILKRVFEKFDDKIIIIVSHRKEILQWCDRIINIEDGQIV